MESSIKAEQPDLNANRLNDGVAEFKKNNREISEMEGDIRNILRFTAGTDVLFFFEGIVI